MTKTTKNKNHRGSASQFFVAGELCRRGYVAVVTMGNTPNTDILCSNEEGTKFVYKAFNITKETPFNGEEEYADFVIWDGLYDAEVAYGVITNDKFSGFLSFSHVEIEIDLAIGISSFVKNASKAQLQFFKDSGT